VKLRPHQLLGGATALSLFAMMSLMLADVLGRKFLGQPVMGAVEIGELLLLVTVYTAIPLVTSDNEHIHLDLIDNFIPSKLTKLREKAGSVFCSLAMLGAAALIFKRAMRTYEGADATTLLQIATWPFHFGVALLLLLNAVVHIRAALNGYKSNSQETEES